LAVGGKMKRRIIKQGHNTLTITLPTDWAKKFNIKPGDEVDINEQGRNIIITPNVKAETTSTTIDITGLSVPLIWRFVSSAYRDGHNTIKIMFENKPFCDMYTAFTYDTFQLKQDKNELSSIEAIQSLVNRFVGVEIIEQRTNYCIVQELGETSIKEFENALRRIFLLLQSLSQGTIEAINGKKDTLKAAHIMDTNIDRFEDFCLRVLNKNGYSDFKKTQTMYAIVFLLELLGDEYKRLAIHLIDAKKITPEIAKYLRHVDTVFNEYYDLYYSFSKEKVEKVYKRDLEAHNMFENITEKISSEDREILHHLKKMVRFIISLTELRIDLEYIQS
jgi:AbrB family looped-hinge helix DNA binding protein